MPTSPTLITALPTPPSRNDSATFSARGDAFLGAFPTFRTETNAVATVTYNNAVEVASNTSTVAANTTLAQNAASSAAASAGASIWVSGTTYSIGDVRYSPANGQIYRRLTAGGGTTDPSADGTNWTNVFAFTFSGSNATLAGSLTLSGGTANGVLYLNGSKVATSGSALVFDGTNLGIGTTSPDVRLQVTHDNAETSQFNLGASILHLTNTNTTNNNWAQIFFTDSDGGAAAATFGVQYTDHANDYGNLSFATRGSSGLAERVRITSGGVLCVGGTNTDPSANAVNGIALTNDFLVSINRSNNYALDIGRNGTDGAVASFRRNATQVGTISVDATNTAYNTSSDRRLKENIVPADDAGLIIDAIKIVKHDWKVGGHTRFGVVAQDLHNVAPEAVKVGDNGDEVTDAWGVDYSKLVPMLVKEIQSLRARVAQLESK